MHTPCGGPDCDGRLDSAARANAPVPIAHPAPAPEPAAATAAAASGPLLVYPHFLPVQWARLRRLVSDRLFYPKEYERWYSVSMEHSEQLAQHQLVLRIVVDVERLLQWCVSRGVPINSEQRKLYVQLLAQRALELNAKCIGTIPTRGLYFLSDHAIPMY